MILVGTFFSVGGASEVPRTTVVQIRTPNYAGMGVDRDKSRKVCEKMGQMYKVSLLADMPDETKLIMTCLPDLDVLDD